MNYIRYRFHSRGLGFLFGLVRECFGLWISVGMPFDEDVLAKARREHGLLIHHPVLKLNANRLSSIPTPPALPVYFARDLDARSSNSKNTSVVPWWRKEYRFLKQYD